MPNFTSDDELGPIHVMFESEFRKLSGERAGSPIWKGIVYIQSVLKIASGISDSVNYTYYPSTTQ